MTTPPSSTSSPARRWKPASCSARITPIPFRPALEVSHRLLVVEVIARDEPIDPRPGHAEGPVPLRARPRSRARPPAGTRGARRAPPRVWRPPHPSAAGSSTGTRRASAAASASSPLAGRARGDEHGNAASPSRSCASPRAGGRWRPGRLDEIGLGQREDARQRRPGAVVVLGQLALDRRVVGDRVGAVERREVEHVHQQPRALDVGQEVVAEPRALRWPPRSAPGCRRARAGGRRRRACRGRLERGERVVGDLRGRAR